jgi:integrase
LASRPAGQASRPCKSAALERSEDCPGHVRHVRTPTSSILEPWLGQPSSELDEVDFSKPWRPNYATLAFGRLRDELGLDAVKLHQLRRFSATQLLSAGIDIRTVSGRLGHANASTTLDFCAQFLHAADERAADALGALLDRR